MRVRKRQGGETLIVLSTEANRSLGVFFIFCGVTASAPLWYLWCIWFGRMPRTMYDWYPAFIMSAVLILIGFMLAVNSKKQILVVPDHIRVWDGLFRRPLTFTWTDSPSIKLQHLDLVRNDRTRVVWIAKLVSGRYEYTLDERSGQQLQARALGEAIAKALGCPLEEKVGGVPMVIEAKDLDLPFRERVMKHPNLLGATIERPAACPIVETNVDGQRRFTWGVATTGLVVDILAVGMFFIFMSAIPTQPDQSSILEEARNSGNYTLYLSLGAVIGSFLLLVAGFKVTLLLLPDAVSLRETLWGLPIGVHSIQGEKIEEVQVTRTVRGPLVQVVSDQQLFQFRVTDSDVADWLGYEVRRHLVGQSFTTVLRTMPPLPKETS